MLTFRDFTPHDRGAYASAALAFVDGRPPQIAPMEIEGLPAVVIHDRTEVQIRWQIGDVQRVATVDVSALPLLSPQITFDQLADLPGFWNAL